MLAKTQSGRRSIVNTANSSAEDFEKDHSNALRINVTADTSTTVQVESNSPIQKPTSNDSGHHSPVLSGSHHEATTTTNTSPSHSFQSVRLPPAARFNNTTSLPDVNSSSQSHHSN